VQQNRELWFVEPGRVELRQGVIPSVRPGTVLARAIASGISQGTELLLFRGQGANPFDPSLGDAGGATYPRRYGYAWVGQIIDVGDDAGIYSIGDQIFALAPHGDMHVLAQCVLRVIDRSVPAKRAVLAANLETAVNCVWDSGASIGDTIVVMGAGVVGLLIAWLCKRVGANVLVVEPAQARSLAARQLGVAVEKSAEAVRSFGNPDIVIEASGNPEALQSAMELAGHEGLVVVVSNYGSQAVRLNLGEHFHRKRLSIRSSQVSAIPAARCARWSLARRFELVGHLLQHSQLDILVNHEAVFDSAPSVYQQLHQDPGRWLQTVFTYV
jgi:2-desacetyl-2-hydroxyethyl bacteriochlorophyllide A dehydrogenase